MDKRPHRGHDRRDLVDDRGSTAERDLLMVELITVDRFHRALMFPFVNGWLRAAGVSTEWLRFGLPAAWRLQSTEAGFDLGGEDGTTLLDAVATARPRAVLLSHPPTAELAARIADQPSAPRIGVVVESTDRNARARVQSHWQVVRPDVQGLAAFAGCEAIGESDLVADATPDYGWRAGNRAARLAQPLPFVMIDRECTYSRSYASNPRFVGLDLEDCSRRGGCAFCTRTDGEGAWPVAPMEMARRQLEAIEKTHPPFVRLAVRMVGEGALRNVEKIAELVCDLGLPACDLLLDGRADRINATRDQLERALGKLEGTGHTLHLCLIGIESFVDAELGLLNKGFRWPANFQAVQALFELEKAHPLTFAFREHGGLSLLLLTPWTRPADLALNFAIIRRAGLLDVCGKALTSRLRLYPSLPLYALAQRDGLLADGPYEDPLLDTARRNFYPDEVPWRFQNPELEPVSRLLLRLSDAETGTGRATCDPLEEAAGKLRRAPWLGERMAIAEALVDAVIDEPEIRDPIELARRILAPRQEAPAVSRKTAARPDPADSMGAWDDPTHLLAVKIGLKPVSRLERVEGELPLALETIARYAPVARTRESRNVPGTHEIFFGHDLEKIDRAAAVTDATERAEDEATWREAAIEVGPLLGYPDCCTRAFVDRSSLERHRYSWLHVVNRVAVPGDVPAILNPFVPLVAHVPCSLDCEATLRAARSLADAIRQEYGDDLARQRMGWMENPWAMVVDEEGIGVELRPEQEPSGRFHYAAGSGRRDHPLARCIAESDEVVIEDQQVLFLRHGRLAASCGGRVFIWWYRAPLQPAFWQALAALRFAHEHGRGRAVESDATPWPSMARAQLSDRLAEAVRVALDDLGSTRAYAGYRVVRLEADHHERLSVVLASGDDAIRLLVAVRRRTEAALVRCGPLAFMLAIGEELETKRREQAVREFARLLGRNMARLVARREAEL